MERKFRHPKRIPSEYLDDMLLESFLNDEYDELQEDIQENIFGLQEWENLSQYTLEDKAQEHIQNKCLLENNMPSKSESKEPLEVKVNQPSQLEASANLNSQPMLAEAAVNFSSVKCTSVEIGNINFTNTVRKRKTERLETKKTERYYVESIQGYANNTSCNSSSVVLDDDRVVNEKLNIADSEETIISNEVKSNGSVPQSGPMEFLEENVTHRRTDDTVEVHQHNIPSVCPEKQNYLACKNGFLLSIKICLIVLFSILLYYFIMHK